MTNNLNLAPKQRDAIARWMLENHNDIFPELINFLNENTVEEVDMNDRVERNQEFEDGIVL